MGDLVENEWVDGVVDDEAPTGWGPYNAGELAPRPPTPVRSYGERESVAPVFWPRRVAPPPSPVAPSSSPESLGPVATAHPVPSTAAPLTAPLRAFAGWAADGSELYRALLPARVQRPTPLHVAEAPLMRPLSPPLTPARPRVPPRACTLDDLGDDDVRAVREHVRAVGGGGSGRGWADVACGFWHRLRSAASWPLELPSPLRRYTNVGAVHEPPD